MISIQFSVPGPRFTAQQQAAFRQFGEWTVLNERGALLFVEGVGQEANLSAALAALDAMGRSAKIIGVWMQDGSRHHDYPNVDHDEFAAVAPDRYDADGNALPRRTQFEQVHKYLGWGDKQ